MPDSKLRELAIEALTNLNAKKPSRLAKTKDIVALLTSLLALPTALISVIALLQQAQRAAFAEKQNAAVQATAAAADINLATTRDQVGQLIAGLTEAAPQDPSGAIKAAIATANTIEQGVAGTQTQLRAVTEPTTAQAGWQVVIGDYADLKEAGKKQNAAGKLGYSNSEIFGKTPHLHMRFPFSTKEDATIAAEKLKAAGISHEPDVVRYRPNG
jgi:hypothetical protein